MIEGLELQPNSMSDTNFKAFCKMWEKKKKSFNGRDTFEFQSLERWKDLVNQNFSL
jgi:hypothetical protein